MHAITFSIVALLASAALGQDNPNIAILDPPVSDSQAALRREMCQVLADNGGIVDQGPRIWEELFLNSVLLDYLNENPPIDDWTGRLYRDELISQAVDGFRCIEEDDNCVIGTRCEDYFLGNGPWISLAIQNLWRIIRAQIKGYDRAVEIFDANNQDLAKKLFSQSGLGRNRAVFDLGAFLSGLLLGAQLAIPAITASTPTLAGVFSSLFQSQLQGVALDGVLEFAEFFGPDPANDGVPFVTNLRESFIPLQNTWRSTLRGYMDTGITSLQLQNTNADIVNFLQNGELLNMIEETDEEMIDAAAREIIRQVAAPVVAKIWFDQGVRFTRRFVQGSPCDNRALCSIGNQCGAFKEAGFPVVAGEFADPNCLDMATGFDLPPELLGVLGELNLPISEIVKNANQCDISGGSGKFPPDKTDLIDFGFPRCTWALGPP